jgi:hypothetical protein
VLAAARMPTRALQPVSSPCCSAASAHVAARLSGGAAALRQPPAHRQGVRALHRSAAVCMAAGKQVEVRGRGASWLAMWHFWVGIIRRFPHLQGCCTGACN